jgi:Putative beta-barrel porin 2
VAREEAAYGGAVELRVMSRTFVGVRADRRTFSFDENAIYQGANLSDQLDRATTTAGLSLRYDLTSLTSLSFTAMRSKDEFKVSTLRDSNSTLFATTVTFDPFALIKGKATVGYRSFVPEDPDLPRYDGSIGAVDLACSVYGTTKFTVKFARDIQYSYDINQPYYLQTGVDFEVAQQIFGPVDIVGRVGSQRLDYSDRRGAAIAVPNRIDLIHQFGGGVGYRLGKDLRLGFNVDSSRRISEVESRPYEGLIYGASLTYAF